MIDFSAWDSMLKHYVNGQGQVDYAAWCSESYQELEAWLTSQRHIKLNACSQDEAIAFPSCLAFHPANKLVLPFIFVAQLSFLMAHGYNHNNFV